ncbi:MAG: protoporphyrinogen oxidase [Ignavibacteriae bacterium]|nr:MAG: protoporphyrinogen oxidase [Ignavibacteriota bacterium]
MGPIKTDVIIVGEGITGLGIAYWLKKRGINVAVLAKEGVAGGTMKSVKDQGFLYETGANTALETSPHFKELVSELKLESEFIYANPEGNNRYILRNGILNSMPLGAGSFFFTKLFSLAAKIRLLKEPFIGRAEKEESIAEFVERRLGREFLDYAIDPFVAGVFAGKTEQLSVRSAFPKLYALEEKYGGLVKGMIKGAQERKQRAEKAKDRAETFSFVSGMQMLPQAICSSLGKAVYFNAKVTGVRNLTTDREEPSDEPDARRYLVEYLHHGKEEEIEGDVVVFAVPAYDAAPIIKPISKETAHVLSSIYYSPVVSLFLGVRREDIGHPLDGFGFLIPSKEQRKILGCLWNSCLFGNRAPSGMAALNAFIGGARQPELTDLSDEQIIQMTLDELKSIMQFSGKAVYLNITRWHKSIPQYEIGYQSKMDCLTRFEESNPGIVLAGNYRGGISVGDCIQNAYERAGDISTQILSTR